VDAVAQITKSGYVYVFDRANGNPLFPIAYRATRHRRCPASRRRRASPIPRCRRLRQADVDGRHADHAHAQRARFGSPSSFAPIRRAACTIRRTPAARSSSPVWTAGGEGAVRRSTRNGLLYVNANEMPLVSQARRTERQVAVRRELRRLPRRRSHRYRPRSRRSSASAIGEREIESLSRSAKVRG